MSKEKIAVAGGFVISWLIAAKTITRTADTVYLGGFFHAGWPIPVKLGLALPTGGQIFWVALANSWIFIIAIWGLLTLVLPRTHK